MTVAALQGTWKIVTLEIDGHSFPAMGSIEIDSDRFTTRGMGAEYSGRLEADFTASPATLDMVFTAGPENGNRNLAIFEVDKDTMKLCVATRGTQRPTEFATRAGSGFAFETLKRLGT